MSLIISIPTSSVQSMTCALPTLASGKFTLKEYNISVKKEISVIAPILRMPSFMAAVVAEWLRRWTRNPLGSARAGSNPADCVIVLICHINFEMNYMAYPHWLHVCWISGGVCEYFGTWTSYCSRGRVVKAIDSKSIGLCPRRFESCRLRDIFYFISHLRLILRVIPKCISQFFFTFCPVINISIHPNDYRWWHFHKLVCWSRSQEIVSIIQKELGTERHSIMTGCLIHHCSRAGAVRVISHEGHQGCL